MRASGLRGQAKPDGQGVVEWPKHLEELFTMYKHKEDAVFDSKKVVFTLYLQVSVPAAGATTGCMCAGD